MAAGLAWLVLAPVEEVVLALVLVVADATVVATLALVELVVRVDVDDTELMVVEVEGLEITACVDF